MALHRPPKHLVKGAFHVPLLRFYDNERYAIDFAEHGRARLTLLQAFRTDPSARKDESEGLGRLAQGPVPFVVSGRTPVEVVATNPFYILSFTQQDVDHKTLAQRFGKYAVQIDDPRILNAAIPEAVIHLPPDRILVSIRLAQVRYDKDGPPDLLTLRDAAHLPFNQKLPSFAAEKEWRIAVILSGETETAPKHLHVEIPLSQKLKVQLY
jgi:hypothetical protein